MLMENIASFEEAKAVSVLPEHGARLGDTNNMSCHFDSAFLALEVYGN